MIKNLLRTFAALGMLISAANAQQISKCGTADPNTLDPNRADVKAYLEANQEMNQYIQDLANNQPQNKGQAKKIIPIVFHVMHTNGAENIDKQKIIEQVDILTKDFMTQNADTSTVRDIYKSRIAFPEVEFRLAKIDPNGNCTDGIVRVFTEQTNDADDPIKALSKWPTDKYFNVWVVKSISGSGGGSIVVGRAQFPGFGSTNTYGVLMNYQAIGNNTIYSNRTLSHEVGHCLNLRHIWGDTNCGDDDVSDTPTHTDANQGCPRNKQSTCGLTPTFDMIENYMDYTDCTVMFSQGQDARMQAVLNSTTYNIKNIWTSQNLIATGTNDGYVAPTCKPVAYIKGYQQVCQNGQIVFSDLSWNGNVTSRKWTFEGGVADSDTASNPKVTYNTVGTYDVTLVVSNSAGSDTLTLADFVSVIPTQGNAPFGEGFESPTFQTDKSYIIISDDNNTWQRSTEAAFEGTSSIYIKNFQQPTGKIDELILPPVDLETAPNPIIRFHYAYARRTSNSADELQLAVSQNCGLSWLTKYKKSGATFTTANNTLTNFVPTSSQWKEDEVALTNIKTLKNGLIKFVNVAGGGNNIWIDNIQIYADKNNPTSIVYSNKPSLSVYPNPVNMHSKVVYFDTKAQRSELKVVDLTGRVLVQQTLQTTSGRNEVSIGEYIQGLQSGVYYLSINNTTKTITIQ